MNFRLFWCSALALATASDWMIAPSYAQPGSSALTEEMIVMARRREENIQTVPVAVTAVGHEKIEQLVINTTQDFNKLAPGLSTSARSHRRTFQPVIRGQGTAFATGQASVIPYFAEVANFTPAFYDLESIQVAKGPQGTLFGETATGGVILFQPRKPTNEFNGYANVQVGNYAYKQFEGAIGGAIIPDKLMFRVAGEYRNRDGFTTAISTYGAPDEDYDNEDTAQWRVSVLWKPTETIESYTLYAGSDIRYNGNSMPISYGDRRFMNPAVRNIPPSFVPIFATGFRLVTGRSPPAGLVTFGDLIDEALVRQLAAGPRVTFTNFDRHHRDIFTGLVNQTSWDILDNLTVKNIFGTYWTKSKGPVLDIDGTDWPIVDTRATWVPGNTDQTSGGYAWTGGLPSRNWTEELQFQGTLFDDRLDWQAGGYFRIATGLLNSSRDWVAGQGTIAVFALPQGDPASVASGFCAALGVANPCSAATRTRGKSYAGYFQATYAITPDINFTGGYRRTWDTTVTETTAVPTHFLIFEGIPFAQPVSGREPIPGAGINTNVVPLATANTYTVTADWQATDDVLLYVAHRTGYKGGGINANALPGDPDRIFGPERIKDIELGIKADWEFNGVRARTNLALYRSWYTDIQRSQVIPGTATTLTTNLADGILQGVELEATVSPVSWFELGGSFSFTDTKWTDWTENALCAAQYWRPQCLGLPGATPVVINHAEGVITIAGSTINFEPDMQPDLSKYQWAIQPAVLLEEFLGEDVSIRANVYHRSKFTQAPSNTSIVAGVPLTPIPSLLGADQHPDILPGYTVADLRLDWRNIRDTRVSLGMSITNLTDKVYSIQTSGGFTIGGTAPAAFAEPRMWFLDLTYEFGAE